MTSSNKHKAGNKSIKRVRRSGNAPTEPGPSVVPSQDDQAFTQSIIEHVKYGPAFTQKLMRHMSKAKRNAIAATLRSKTDGDS